MLTIGCLDSGSQSRAAFCCALNSEGGSKTRTGLLKGLFATISTAGMKSESCVSRMASSYPGLHRYSSVPPWTASIWLQSATRCDAKATSVCFSRHFLPSFLIHSSTSTCVKRYSPHMTSHPVNFSASDQVRCCLSIFSRFGRSCAVKNLP